MAERITSYRYGEGATKEGQIVHFTAPLDEFDQAQEALGHFKSISIPSSAEVNVSHGGYGRYSRYEVEQLDYAGGQNEAGGGYYEILQIKNAPDDRVAAVSHGYMHTGEWFAQFFAEWESTDHALAHREEFGRGKILTLRDFEKQADQDIPGLIRVVNTGYLSPWFYATGDASLVGDVVFPEHLAQDSVFTFGRQFLVPEKSDKSDQILHRLKTCMGCIVEEKKDPIDVWGRRREVHDEVKKYRIVQWHDGSATEVYPSTAADMLPVPLAEKDTWVTEAQRKFCELLSGQTLGFEIQFVDGGTFVGKYVPPAEKPKPSPAGDYYALVTFEDDEPIEGWVHDFSPTEDTPNITSYIAQRLAKNGKKILQIEITNKKGKSGGRKWAGVFHNSLAQQQAESDSAD